MSELLDSYYKELIPVQLPYKERQRYMHTFDLSRPIMAEGFEDYLEPVVALCATVGAVKGLAHMTVDEKVVAAGMSQRRPKPHVDGCFVPAMNRWGGTTGQWNHYCNDVGASKIGRMPVIVAASVAGCRVWSGRFEGRPAKDGDLSHIMEQLGAGKVLPAGVGFWLSPDCVHESMVFDKPTQRTFLRIALPAHEVWEGTLAFERRGSK
jgi:hypothetical protein